MTGGAFKASYYHDNGLKMAEAKTITNSNTRLRMTGEKFITSNNAYTTFLADKEDLPRLSILQNYD